MIMPFLFLLWFNKKGWTCTPLITGNTSPPLFVKKELIQVQEELQQVELLWLTKGPPKIQEANGRRHVLDWAPLGRSMIHNNTVHLCKYLLGLVFVERVKTAPPPHTELLIYIQSNKGLDTSQIIVKNKESGCISTGVWGRANTVKGLVCCKETHIA